jgi:thiol:disulfide interchange protein DsbA
MTGLRRFTTAVSLLIGMLASGAVLAAPVEGKEYQTLKSPQATDAPGKVEVLEFFQYGCGHCYDFEPHVKAWAAKKPKDVEFRYVPTVWDESRIPQAKIYYTLEALGLVEEYHEKAYEAIHQRQLKLWDRAVLMKWVAQQPGIDARKFEETYDSFGVDNKVKRAVQLTRAYPIRGTPAVIVNGRYITGPSYVIGPGGKPDFARFGQVLDELIAAERKKK